MALDGEHRGGGFGCGKRRCATRRRAKDEVADGERGGPFPGQDFQVARDPGEDDGAVLVVDLMASARPNLEEVDVEQGVSQERSVPYSRS
jgi:hypothetical protein